MRSAEIGGEMLRIDTPTWEPLLELVPDEIGEVCPECQLRLVLWGSNAWRLVYLGILSAMAKVMVSMPDDLLAEVDAEAARAGTSRSAVLREFAVTALRRRREDRAAAMEALLAEPVSHGGRAGDRVKETRPSGP